MRQIILAISGLGGLFLLAGALRNKGWPLADQVCSAGAVLCDNTYGLLVAIAVLIFIATVQSIVKT